MFFANRAEAGQRLAEALSQYKKDDVVVLAIPRGRVPIGAEVSKTLNAPLDTIEALQREVDEIVRLSAPQGFLAIGQFYSDFKQLTDAEVIDLLGSAAVAQEASTTTHERQALVS